MSQCTGSCEKVPREDLTWMSITWERGYAPTLTGRSGRSKHSAVRSCVALLCMASAVHTKVGELCEKGQWADILAVA